MCYLLRLQALLAAEKAKSKEQAAQFVALSAASSDAAMMAEKVAAAEAVREELLVEGQRLMEDKQRMDQAEGRGSAPTKPLVLLQARVDEPVHHEPDSGGGGDRFGRGHRRRYSNTQARSGTPGKEASKPHSPGRRGSLQPRP